MVLLSLNIVYFEQGGVWGVGVGSCNHTICKNSIIIAISAPINTVSTIGMMIAYWKILANIIWPSQVKWRLMIASCYRRAGNYHKVFIIIMMLMMLLLLLLLTMMMLLMMMRIMILMNPRHWKRTKQSIDGSPTTLSASNFWWGPDQTSWWFGKSHHSHH